MPNVPLQGIRVVSFCTGGVIPDAGKILGELGADVIKIESKENMDFVRTIGPDPNNIAGFNEGNRNKRSFGVNLKTEKGKDLVRQLIRISDIVGENFRGGALKSLGFSYDEVKKVKPDIIYISSQGFGSTGPYTDYQAYGPMLAAASGVLCLWAHPDEEYPVGANVPFPDHMASKLAVFAAVSALDYRRRTGKGQFIDMSQVEVAANTIGEYYLEYLINDRVPTGIGNRHRYTAPHNAYRCKGNDEWCAISVFTGEEWDSFCKVLGSPAWTKNPKFATLPARLKNADELDQLITEWTLEREPVEIMNAMQAAGVAAGAVERTKELLNDPQMKHLNTIIEVDHPVSGKRMYPRSPFRMTGATIQPSTPAPLLGQHTEEICRELLNLSDADIQSLKEDNVLETV